MGCGGERERKGGKERKQTIEFYCMDSFYNQQHNSSQWPTKESIT